MPDDRWQDIELNRFWNELTGASGDAAAGGLDQDQAETLHRLHAMTRTAPPAVAQARLERAMRAQIALYQNGHASSRPRQIDVLAHSQPRTPSAERREPQAPRPAHREKGWGEGFPQGANRHHWPIAQFATVLLLAVTIGLAYFTLEPMRRTVGRLVGIPVTLFAPENLTPGVTNEETLFEIALPAEAIPHGNRVSGGLAHFSLAPGKRTTWDGTGGGCCPGFRFDYVLEGTFTVRPAGYARVFRAAANLSPETVAPGQEVTLGPGDAVMLRYEDAFDSANPGSAPVQLLDISFIDGFFQLRADGPGWELHLDADVAYSLTVPDQPATLRLTKVDLAPGAIMPPSPGAVTQLGITLADNAPLDVHNTDSIGNINDEPVTVHVVTLLPVQAEDLVLSSPR